MRNIAFVYELSVCAAVTARRHKPEYAYLFLQKAKLPPVLPLKLFPGFIHKAHQQYNKSV